LKERVAGIDPSMLVEAHGSFGEASCIECKEPHSQEWIKQELFKEEEAECRLPPRCLKCKEKDNLVKPNIVFFGEDLPRRFFDCQKEVV
jgi:NAD-dependent SIR2 family protein deacetylase